MTGPEMDEDPMELLRKARDSNVELTAGVKNLTNLVKRRVLPVGVVLILALSYLGWRFVDYASCNSDRNRALSGPANARITYLFDGLTASITGTTFDTSKDRARAISMLNTERKKFPLIPSPDILATQHDYQVIAILDFVLGTEAHAKFIHEQAKHPVCGVWW